MNKQQAAIAHKLKAHTVKNRYAAKGKIKKIQRSIDHFKWLAQ